MVNEEQVKEIVRRETIRLEKRIEQLERDLLLTKQHTTQAVQLMAENFSTELDNLLKVYASSYEKAAMGLLSHLEDKPL
ncbi:hypothetical protein [Paenibacillus fonticola]|uniref:hypothetical protein n=1 Tax=Paenibacillus fonticola TaxID=379896 RepID=UPI00037AC402|nr:hypothetical protein [Paenibacillus fonticola]